MKTYKINFIGRQAGSLGLLSKYNLTIQAETEEAARLKLYDTHEHITVIKLKQVKK